MSDLYSVSATKREVWEHLRDVGPQSFDQLRVEFGEGVSATVRELKRTGHISYTLDRRVEANGTDELQAGTSPFGAGGGTFEGEPPKDEVVARE